MKQLGLTPLFLRGILILFAALSVSACTLPLPSQPREKACVYETATFVDKCNSTIIERELNDLRCQVEEGHCYAAVCLGHRYLTGYRAPRDTECAFKWYRLAAEAGIPTAQVQMGHFYRDGCKVVCRDMNTAIHWYQAAADQGDITAILALGELYKGWHGVAPDFKKALCWYERAANCGSVDAEYQVALLLNQGVKKCHTAEGFERLMALAEQGHPDAMASLGDIYYQGRRGPRDLQKAYDYYCQSAKLGSAVGAFKLAMFYTLGECVYKNHEKAAEWFLEAAKRGLPEAEMYAGDLYRDGRGVVKSYQTAALWYQKAANHGVAAANRELGDLYHAGKGVPRYLEEAVRRYHMAADCGNDTYSALMLSVLYEMGRGIPYDLKSSVAYYETARRQPGFLRAEYKVGRRFATGFGFSRDMKNAMRWYSRAAAGGLSVAQVEIGDLFYIGECVPQDFGKAFQWYQKAALKGNSYAQNMLGLILLEGDCLPQYTRTTVPEVSLHGKIAQLKCPQCKETVCVCEPAYSERQGTGCALCLIRGGAQQLEAQCKCAPKAACNCGARYAYRAPVWAMDQACGSKHLCGTQAGRCTVSISRQNAQKAANWIRRAAMQGAPQAQFQLGVLYSAGIGVPKNEAMAYAWLSTALEGMEDDIPDVIHCLIDKMSPETRKRAVCLADRYQNRFKKTVHFPAR